MTAIRSSIILVHNASDVWNVVRDVPNISQWFPAMSSSTGDLTKRTVTLTDGTELIEEIITLNDGMRRLQYQVVGGGVELEYHLGTVDVFAIDEGTSLLSYSTEIAPQDVAETFDAAIEEAVQNLASFLADASNES